MKRSAAVGATKRNQIVYLSVSRIPARKAEAWQDMAMCSAFSSLGMSVLLIYPAGLAAGQEDALTDPFEFYGITPTFHLEPVFPRLRVQENRTNEQRLRGRRIRVVGQVMHRLRLARRASRYDALFWYTRDPIAAWWLAFRGKQVMWEVVNFPDRISRPFARALLKYPKVYVAAISCGLGRDVSEELGKKRSISYLPVGVDHHRYDKTPGTIEECRRRLGLPVEGALAVYTGYMRRDRGIDVIVRAAAKVPEVRFLLVGGRPNEVERLRRLSLAEGAANVEFSGEVPPTKIPHYQRAANVLLLPQSGTTRHLAEHVCPTKLFEYMAAGRVVVAADLPCIQEIIRHGENGILVDPNSPDAWSEAISGILSDQSRALRLSEALGQMSPRFSWNERARNVLALVP